MYKHFNNNRNRWLLGAAMICFVYLMWSTFTIINKANAEARTGRSSLQRLQHFENIQVHVHAIESGEQEFLKSGNENLLTSYYNGLAGLGKDTARLFALQCPTIMYEAQAKQLTQFIQYKISNSAGILQRKRLLGSDFARLVIEIKAGKDITDSITSYIFLLQRTDRSILESANEQQTKSAFQSMWKLWLVAVFFLILLLVIYYMVNKDLNNDIKANKLLKFNASVARNIFDPVVTTDLLNNITSWNVYAGELYGYTEAEALGKNMEALLSAADATTRTSGNKINSHKKDFWKGGLIQYHKNGQRLYTEVTTSAIRDPDSGDETGFVSVIRSVAEWKNTEEKLQKIVSKLQEEVEVKSAELNIIFERITEAFIALDNEWNYTYVNKKAAELHDKPIDELLGKNMLDEYPDLAEGQFYQALLEAKKTNIPSRVQLFYPKTGRWFEDLIYPSPEGISVYYHDITDTKRSEISLLKTHEKLTYHIDNTPMGVVEFDANLNVVQWSDRTVEIFGWSKTELSEFGDKLLASLVFEEDLELVNSQLQIFFDKKSDRGFIEVRNRTRDGRIIFCEWYTSALINEQGEVTGLMSLVHDITKRKQVQTELEEAETKFRCLVEQSMVGVYIIQAKKFIYVNPRLEEITGYDAYEIGREKIFNNIVHPDDLELVIGNISRRFEGLVKSLHYELRLIHKNGTVIYTEVFGTITQYMGQPAIIGTLIDVTEKKEWIKKMQQSQADLAASNERFLLLAKATNDAVWDWDIATNKLWGNEVFSNYFNKAVGSEIRFEDFLERIHPDDKETLLSNLKMARAQKQSLITDLYLFRLCNGNYINIYDRANIIYDEHGNAVRMLGAMQDITALKTNERQILLEKELSDTIINSLPGVFYLYNQAGQFYRWNSNFQKVSGYSTEEIIRLNPLNLIDTEDKELLGAKIANVFLNGEDFVETNLLAKDGTKTPYYFTGKVIQYEGEACLMGVGIDITEKIKSKQQLAQSEERYRTIIEQASDGIFISDQRGNYLDVNSNGVQLSGYSKAELLSMTIYDLMLPGDMGKNPPKLKELYQGGHTINERILKAKDGSLREVEISATLLGDGRFLGIVRDITKRKKDEEILKASEEKYRLLFNQNPIPMWMISLPEKKFLDVNAAASEFYGYSKEDFFKMTVYDIRPKKSIPVLKQYEAKKLAPGVNHAGVWEHLKKDGTLVKVNIITHDINYEGSEARLVLANDVTKKIIAEEALQKSHQELRQLATHLEAVRETERTNIAREIHDELGQQLTGLKMDISWISKKLKGQDEEIRQKIKDTICLVDETVKTVRRIATELRPSILDDLGLLSAMEWQSSEFEKRSEIICGFLSNVSEATVAPDVATNVFRIYQECLTNVLRHAEATQVNSFLQIKDDILMLTITDNGKGFVETEINSKKTLGLLGMKERALLLGGTYEITSRPACGTSVLIIIPLKK